MFNPNNIAQLSIQQQQKIILIIIPVVKTKRETLIVPIISVKCLGHPHIVSTIIHINFPPFAITFANSTMEFFFFF